LVEAHYWVSKSFRFEEGRKCAKAAGAPDPLHHVRRLLELIAAFGVEAMTFTAKPKVEDTAHQWLARAPLDSDDPHSAGTVAHALMLALELAMFAPSLSGSTCPSSDNLRQMAA